MDRTLESGFSLASWRKRLRIGKKTGVSLLAAEFHKKRACPFCVWASRTEATCVEIFLEFMGDLSFERAYANSDGLCFPHFLVIAEIGRENADFEKVARHTSVSWKRWLKHLRGFTDKHDWLKRQPPSEEESRSAFQVLEIFSGKAGLFSSEMRRVKDQGLLSLWLVDDRESTPEPTPVEALQFEKEKLEIENKRLVDALNRSATKLASQNYKLWEIEEERKRLEMAMNGYRAEIDLYRQAIEQLREENETLRKMLGRQDRSHESP